MAPSAMTAVWPAYQIYLPNWHLKYTDAMPNLATGEPVTLMMLQTGTGQIGLRQCGIGNYWQNLAAESP